MDLVVAFVAFVISVLVLAVLWAFNDAHRRPPSEF